MNLQMLKISTEELLLILIQSASVPKFLNFIPIFLIKPLVLILSSITCGAFPFTITRHEVVPSYKTHYEYKQIAHWLEFHLIEHSRSNMYKIYYDLAYFIHFTEFRHSHLFIGIYILLYNL